MRNKLFYPMVSGLLIGFSYPPFPFGYFAWFAFLPLLFFWRNNPNNNWKSSGYIAGVAANLIPFHWLAQNNGTHWSISLLTMILSVLFLALNFSVLGWALQRFFRIWKDRTFLLFPLFWVTIEWLRTLTSLAFPWGSLAGTSLFFLPISQLATVAGPLGITFWICTLNIILFFAMLHRRSILFVVAFLWIGIPSLVGLYTMNQNLEPNKAIQIGLVQPDIKTDEKYSPQFSERNIKIMDSLTQVIMEKQPQTKLVVWPETAILSRSQSRVKNISKRANTNILTGYYDFDRDTNGEIIYFNSTAFFTIGGDMKSTPKSRLVPFTEYVPFSTLFGWLHKLNIGIANFQPAESLRTFSCKILADSVLIAPEICYESSFPSLGRAFVNAGGELIAIVSNDGWYRGRSIEPAQHMHLSRFRAIENRVPVVHSTNTGISAVIDPFGRIVEKLGNTKRGVITASIPIATPGTIYTVYGDYIGVLAFTMVLFLLFFEILKKLL